MFNGTLGGYCISPRLLYSYLLRNYSIVVYMTENFSLTSYAYECLLVRRKQAIKLLAIHVRMRERGYIGIPTIASTSTD